MDKNSKHAVNSNKKFLFVKIIIPILLCLIALFALPIRQMNYFEAMPGNLGDARLNNYFLESAYLVVTKQLASFWSLPFFYPFPLTGAFSENLFGSAPIYIVFRLLGLSTDDAFQAWFLFGYILNYFSAYYSLRWLGFKELPSSIGALIFAFSLPTTGHSGHAQLHYRFAIPLCFSALVKFFQTIKVRYLYVLFLGIVWQFYASVYMGFYNFLIISLAITFYSIYYYFKVIRSNRPRLRKVINKLKTEITYHWIGIVIVFTLSLLLLFLLFFPYWQVSEIYGARRLWVEIITMLPQPISYVLSDASLIWGTRLKIFESLPARHEHQMFFGLAPIFLAVLGIFYCKSRFNKLSVIISLGVIGLSILLTLNVLGFSAWYLFYKLPLASAIRSLTRIDQVLLFPLAILSTFGVTELLARTKSNIRTTLCGFIIVFLVIEFSSVKMETLPKDRWRAELKTTEERIQQDDNAGDILFFSQTSELPYADELNAMWVSLKRHQKTLNGYSGVWPPGFTYRFKTDCTELPKRIIAYLNFIRAHNREEEYLNLIKKVRPIGFENCKSEWFDKMPNISISNRVYTVYEFSSLQLAAKISESENKKFDVDVILSNSSHMSFSALSGSGRPIRLSWRFLGAHGQPLSDFVERYDLPFDIPADGSIDVRLPVVWPDGGISGLEVSIVQELEFWGHAIGVETAKVFLSL